MKERTTHKDAIYLSRKLGLPDMYVMSILNFLNKLVVNGLNNENSAVQMIMYQYGINEYLGTQLVSYYFEKKKNIT